MPGHAPAPSKPPLNPNAERGRQLVRLSRILLAAGLLLMIASCGAGIAVRVPFVIFGGAGLGFLVIIGAAVVGQIGRGFQGRVI
ncbi:MAG: hypothetical protein HYY06_10175 [Deltaproteobacteria bacterium]|nr:hypothetical protein [Deltaproteobacteria bacterium]